MRILFLSFLFLASGLSSTAQSISGNLNAGSSKRTLGYGNVDIYCGEALIASVLTDRSGNFNVRLDTGSYTCVVSYDGYVSSTRTVQVRADEKVDFSVVEDASRPARKSWSPEGRSGSGREKSEDVRMHATPARSLEKMDFDRAGSAMDHMARDEHTAGVSSPGYGMLTAGEVNDFSKWTQWEDISATTLGVLRNRWSIAPHGRYTLDLQTKSGLPIVNALVRLVRKDGGILFNARTDNTGKAELWAALDARDSLGTGRLSLEVVHQGRMFRLDKARPFEQGVNRLVIDVPYAPSDNVDVAFVVDATGSMQDELDFLRAEMNDIIYRSKQIGDRLNFRFANVFYRDEGSNEEYLTRSMDFTRVLSAAVNFISDQRADGGGDTPEAVDVALDSAINHLSWGAEARTRIIFLVLDASPHPGREAKMQALVRQAAAKGIRIVTVAASGIDKGTEYLMRTLALGTNGTYTFLTDHSGIGSPHIEPTTDHYEVEGLNNLLVRVLKSYTYMPDPEQRIPELELGYPDSLVQVPGMARPVDRAVKGPEGPTGIPDPLPTVRWSYWPNPTSGLVNITAEVDIPELYITDLSGKVLQLVKVLKAGEPVQVDLSPYATGIYLIRYPYGSSWLSGKVILQRA